MANELGDTLRAVGAEEMLEVLILDVRQIPLLLRIGEIVRQNSLTLKIDLFRYASFAIGMEITRGSDVDWQRLSFA